MNFREYKNEDGEKILSFIKSEREFRLWSANRYGSYPISSNDINKNYLECKKISNFYPFTLTDSGRTIGHLILRNPEKDLSVIRLGFVIVNPDIRGKGYGKILVNKAIVYAREKLGAKEINLDVFTNNKSAIECYKSVGFEITNILKNAYKFHDEYWDSAEMVLKQQNVYS